MVVIGKIYFICQLFVPTLVVSVCSQMSGLRRIVPLASRCVRGANSPLRRGMASMAQQPILTSSPDKETLQKAAVQPVVLKPYVSEQLREEDFFGLESLVTIDNMFDARLHLGHKMGTLNDNMKWALYGERLGICVFDLDVTRKFLLRALNFVAHISMRGGIILFVTSNRNTMFQVEKTAEEVGQYSHTRRWQQGTLTNTNQLLGASVRLPDTIVFLSTLTSLGQNHPAIIEAAKMAIPTVGVVDTNSDPAYLTYLVPANDDTPQSVSYLLKLFKEAISRGQDARARLSID